MVRFTRGATRGRTGLVLTLGQALLLAMAPRTTRAQVPASAPAEGRVEGVVLDGKTGNVVIAAQVIASRDAREVTSGRTDDAGQFALRSLQPGRYRLEARRFGYRPAVQTVEVEASRATTRVIFRLEPTTSSLDAVRVSAGEPMALDARSGDQSYQQRNGHTAPSTTTSQILQQAVAGAARAPTGEVHIRGQHAEYTYYVDGVPVPAGISGSLNELFDPAIADRIEFQTGGWDAEYGNKNIAVVKVATRIPEGGLHAEATAFVGSFASRGTSMLASANIGALGVLLSASRQQTAMRREPVMLEPQTGAAMNFHNAGADENGFIKVEYQPSAADRLTLNASTSFTRFAVPFDSSEGLAQDDHQRDRNAFINLVWKHRIGPADSAPARDGGIHEIFTALYLRRGKLAYEPGLDNVPSFLFYPDTTIRYSVRENRAATTTGAKFDYMRPITTTIAAKVGMEGALVTGHEDFDTRDSLGRVGPAVHAGVRGGDIGAYVQAVITPLPHWELRTGARVDHHLAPLAGDQHQVSPRVRLSYLPDARTSLWLYYGRLFIPSNVEDFHVLASAGQGGTLGESTIPERDHYFEAGLVHRFDAGMTLKLASYLRGNTPAVDDNTLPGTALTTTVNIARVRVRGIESVVQFDPSGPFSAYINAALNHASAHGPITGGFFPTAYPTGWFDQDHDQRLSIVASGTYGFRRGYASVTGIFGSGLTNGRPDAARNETRLFAFNPGVKVAPSFVVNASVGTSWTFGSALVRPELFVDNVLDRRYVLKGAFTSGPSVGRPRSVQVRMSLSAR